MNYHEDSDATKANRRLLLEKDRRQARVMIRYLLFYCAYIVVLSLTNYFLDLLFFEITRGSGANYWYRLAPIQYIPFFIIIGYFIFPLALAYNYFINNMVPEKKSTRVIIGLLAASFCGFLFTPNYRYGYYIGEYRELKNIIAIALSGVFIELMRIWVVGHRNQNRTIQQQ